jgi:hypothetical protein
VQRGRVRREARLHQRADHLVVGQLHVRQVGPPHRGAEDAGGLGIGEVARAQQLADLHAGPVPRAQRRRRDLGDVPAGDHRHRDVRRDHVGIDARRLDGIHRGDDALEEQRGPQEQQVDAVQRA